MTTQSRARLNHPALDSLVEPLEAIKDPYQRSARAAQLVRIRYDEIVLHWQLLNEIAKPNHPGLLGLLSRDPAYQALLVEAFATPVKPASLQA